MSSFGLGGARTWAGRPIARSVADAIPRSQIVTTGAIRSVQTIGSEGSSIYRCVLSDGTGEIDLLFLGRNAVPGLGVGTRCSVEGTVAVRSAHLAIWNPRYELRAAADNRRPEALPQPLRAEALSPPDRTTTPDAGARANNELLPPTTPAPDAAGARAGSRPEVEPTGHYRIYLGAAAGVGKTVAMLDEGNRRRRRGADVVVGFVETHGRHVTEAHIPGLEVIPRKAVDYRGTQLEEMDLDAVLQRRPQVSLVDELAHTNVPGSGRHDKRWQDVIELLDAGIDVVTTVNIQHLESIADAVERITGVPVRERVPDWVVRRADQIELVDSSPEQLRRRMTHGNIYPPEHAAYALAHFFRADNLTALRELALRFVADETEEELLEQLRRYQSNVVWETTERIVVAVTAAPGTDAIIRRASRIAARVKADLQVVHVRSNDTGPRSPDERLAALRQVASDVGAEWNELVGDDPAQVLIDFAAEHQITQVVIGSSQRSRWQELTGGGSIVRRVARLAAEVGIDVHIIARREPVA